jgi:hypothetical protein
MGGGEGRRRKDNGKPVDQQTRERLLLQALCQTADEALRRRAFEALPTHRWANRDHQLIFEGCSLLARNGAPITRGSLATQLTRAGFPEMDFDSLFAPLPSPGEELARRLDELAGPAGPTSATAEGER